MTVAAREEQGRRLLRLLASSDQLPEWAEWMGRLTTRGHRVAVAYGSDRRDEGRRLATAYSAPVAPLTTPGDLDGQLDRNDLLIVITSAGGGKPSLQAVGGLAALDRFVRRGVLIWGITGPRPNPVSPYCHDSLAIPELDPSRLLESHRLVIHRLILLSVSAPPVSLGARGSA